MIPTEIPFKKTAPLPEGVGGQLWPGPSQPAEVGVRKGRKVKAVGRWSRVTEDKLKMSHGAELGLEGSYGAGQWVDVGKSAGPLPWQTSSWKEMRVGQEDRWGRGL